jgi:hypothetical protein
VELVLPGRTGVMRTCPYCGKHYHVANPSRRRTVVATDGRALDDQHLIGCARVRGFVPGVAPTVVVPRDRKKQWRNTRRVCCVCGRRYVCSSANWRKGGPTVGGKVLDDIHRLKCARNYRLITPEEFARYAKPSPGNPLSKLRGPDGRFPGKKDFPERYAKKKPKGKKT